MTTKNYTFYFDVSGQYVISNRDNFNFENTNRNWPARKQLNQTDLICFGSKSPAQRCRGRGNGPANVPKACVGGNWTFNPVRDPYVNLGNRGSTNWTAANNDLMRNKGRQTPMYFSSPEIANSNLNGWSSQSAGQYRCGWRNKKRCNCRRSIGGKDKRWSYWKNVRGWRDCNDGNWQCKRGLCFKIPGNCRTGSNNSNKSTWVTYYEYPCATPKAYTNKPSIENGQYTSPSGATYYVGPGNPFGYSIQMIYRKLQNNNRNSSSGDYKMDGNSFAGFRLNYRVNWSNSAIDGYKLLDLLWFVSYFPQTSSRYKNRKFSDINKSVAQNIAYDYCNIQNAGGDDSSSKGLPNPLCFASLNNMKNNSITLNTLPTILRGPPCQDYKNCPDWKSVNNKGGWMGYCANKKTYNNQFCKNFYSAYTKENVVQQPQIISGLNKTCAQVYKDKKLTIDEGVCGCFMNKTPVYDDIKKAANLPPGFQLGKPKCFYAPCTASLYQNAGTCPNITFSQCIQNSYPSVSAGGSASNTKIAVKQTIENCGPKPKEKKSDKPKEKDNVPAPVAVPPQAAPQAGPAEAPVAPQDADSSSGGDATTSAKKDIMSRNTIIAIVFVVLLLLGGYIYYKRYRGKNPQGQKTQGQKPQGQKTQGQKTQTKKK